MADILSMFNAAEMMDYTRNVEQPPMLGESLFPSTKIAGFEFSYIRGANNLPVAASVAAFDTEAEIGTRNPFDKVTQDLAMIKRKIRMNEREILTLHTNSYFPAVDKAKEVIFNDALNMVTSVKARIEAMRMSVLANGNVSLTNERDLNIPIDYGVDTKYVTDWTSGAVVNDLFYWTNNMLNKTGVQLTRALTSNRVLQTILNSTAVRSEMYGINSSMIPSKGDLNNFLSQRGLPTIETYDARYQVLDKNGNATTQRYFPESKFVLMPDGELGETVFGVTPEELALTNAGVNITNQDNIVVSTYATEDPVAYWTKATAICMPSFPQANYIVQSTVI